MRDFSIDLSSDKIYSAQTRQYFVEVIKSYYSESYRSAIVMLYTVSIADLVYKVRDLHDIYSDVNAEQIMNEITRLQTLNPNSPDWETKLIELVKDQTNLLEPADYLHLVTLQKHRHLCAHPVLTQNFELYSPNRETTRSHIRNMLEGLLVKPPLLSRKILDDFLNHLSLIKVLLNDDEQLEKHLKSKYLDRLQGKALKQVFRSLWRIVFKVTDQPSTDNRNINLKALMIIIKNNHDVVIDMIRDEKDYYSDASLDNIGELITLLNHYPKILPELTASLDVVARNTIETDADLDIRAIFLSKDIETHVTKILKGENETKYTRNYITSQSIIDVFNYAILDNKRDVGFKFLIEMFGASFSYDMADTRYNTLIRPYLDEFTPAELTLIVEKVNTNYQISDRRKANEANQEIKTKIDAKITAFDYAKYPKFTY